jgi:hypothetical protein
MLQFDRSHGVPYHNLERVVSYAQLLVFILHLMSDIHRDRCLSTLRGIQVQWRAIGVNPNHHRRRLVDLSRLDHC